MTRSDLPPSAILAETIAPFEQTRADLANWSAVEMAAFQAATAQAKAECQRLEQTPNEGEEALALARLCSVGMDWDGTYSAARWYTRATAPTGEAGHLALGFGLLLQADLNLQAVPRAMDDLKEMNERLPLSPDTDSVFSYVVNAVEVMRPEYGVQAALMRQPALLEMVAVEPGAAPALPPGQAEAEAWHTVALLHLAQRPTDEADARSRLLQAKAQRTGPISPLDAYLAGRGRAQYEWLGRPAPATLLRSAAVSGKKNDVRPPVGLMVIERQSASDLASVSRAVEDLRKRLPRDESATLILIADSRSQAKQAAGVSLHTFFTAEDLLDTFGFSNGPLFVLEDREGRIAYLGTGTAAWLNPQMQAEALLNRLAQQSAERPLP